MRVDLILVPYDSGHRGLRMGRGPLRLLESGAAERLRAAGAEVREVTIEARPGFGTEVGTAFELARALALAVRSARARGSFPLVLSGNCNASVGIVAGLGAPDTGVVWLDAHGDLNTPETTASGFLDGMALATLTGRCWRTLAASVDGFQPVPDERVVLVGGRDLDPPEAELLASSRIAHVREAAVRAQGVDGALAPALERLAARAGRAYVHLDLDVHDPAEGAANHYAVAGGLSAAEVRDSLGAVARRLSLAAVALTAFDPDHDPDGRMEAVALDLVAHAASLAPG
ncbi:MAG TPA: arginase family protein [Longimicrobiaceae bacterium]|nr:arginase family protein [Longimicrobiaceae bacterium]